MNNFYFETREKRKSVVVSTIRRKIMGKKSVYYI
jgi:hypothetical protein